MVRDASTRRHFVLGTLATATTLLTLDACSDDGARPSGDELGNDTSESAGNESSSSESTTDTTSESTTDTTTESTTDTTTESTTDTTTESTTDTTSESTTDTTSDTTTESTDTGDPICPNGASGTILQNHGHSMVLPAADVQAGVQKVYNIQGAANHNHTVTITAAEFVQLQLGNVVMKTSSFLQAHDHDVLVSCLL